jgi:hypothetical protein
MRGFSLLRFWNVTCNELLCQCVWPVKVLYILKHTRQNNSTNTPLARLRVKRRFQSLPPAWQPDGVSKRRPRLHRHRERQRRRQHRLRPWHQTTDPTLQMAQMSAIKTHDSWYMYSYVYLDMGTADTDRDREKNFCKTSRPPAAQTAGRRTLDSNHQTCRTLRTASR